LKSSTTFKGNLIMSIRYSLAASAAVLLFVPFGGSSAALASDNEPASIEACTTGKDVVFRSVGHPGKSSMLPRRESTTPRCTESDGKALMLVSFIDAPGGTALLAGKADRAIHQLTEQDPGSDNTLALNNLCVAHTALRQWTEARASCDAAVSAAEALHRSVKDRWPNDRRRLANNVAAAVYSNRAVMNWLSLDALAAQGDFSRARTIAPKASFVVRNADLAMRLPARLEHGSLPIG
jgi:hypothetical protein